MNSPGGWTPLAGPPREDSIRPMTKLCVSSGEAAAAGAGIGSVGREEGSAGAAGTGAAGAAGAGSGVGVGIDAPRGGAVADVRAAIHSGNVVRAGRNSLTTANPLGVSASSMIRDRSASGSACTCSRSRSTTSRSGASTMCTMTGRPVDFSWALCVRIPPPKATHLSRRYRSSKLVIGGGRVRPAGHEMHPRRADRDGEQRGRILFTPR